MNYLKWSVIIFITLFFQTQITFFTIHPNLTAALVYIYVITLLRQPSIVSHISSRQETKSTIFGAMIGFIEDAITGTIIGPSFLGKGLIGFLSVLIFTDVFFRWTPVLGGIVILTMTIFERLITALMLMLFKDITINWTYALSGILLQALINLPFGIIIRLK